MPLCAWVAIATACWTFHSTRVLADAPDVGLQAAADVSASRNGGGDLSNEGGRSESTKRRVEELIRQLGSPRYTVRRTAANELRQIGAEAFDLLHAATESVDPEVAASANYLLRQITVRWVRSDDSPAVRRALRNYGNKSEEARLEEISDLSKLPNNEGVAALCRITRFDRSPLLARAAAMAVIRPDERDEEAMPVDPETIDHELGESTRISAKWLRQYRVQLRDPAASVDPWQQIVDDEAALLERNRDETSDEIVLRLMWNLADVHRQLDNRTALMQMVDRMIGLNADAAERTTVDLLLWLVERESWDALEEFLAKYDTQLGQAKRPLYIAALARAKQGKQELAEKLAAKAAELEAQAGESFAVAKELELRNQYEWSVREYRQVIDRQKVESHEAILARVMLASLQFDHASYEDAADVLEPLVKAIQEEGKVAQYYTELRRHHLRLGELALPEREAVAAKLHHYRAAQYHEVGDWEKEREHLEHAIRFDEADADVVIQMYRLPEADEKWREMVRGRIRQLCRLFEQQMEESKNDPTPYNQWAWLVGNTEGDYQRAIRYSHRSLELLGPSGGDSGQASFLDTLGRCYYAAGDLENAVKYQREAIEKLDYMQVMHRQLALFEKALQEKQADNKQE